MDLVIHSIVLILAAVIILCSLALLVVDMFGKVDYLKATFPSLERVLARRSAHVGLLLIAVLLLIGNYDDLMKKEVPEVPKPLTMIVPMPKAPDTVKIPTRDATEENRLNTEIDKLQKELKIREQRTENRKRIKDFLVRGLELKAVCDSLEVVPDIEMRVYSWRGEVQKLIGTIEPSYSTIFNNIPQRPFSSRILSGTPIPEVNNRMWNYVNDRTEVLERILASMPD